MVDTWDPTVRLAIGRPTGPNWALLLSDQERADEAAEAVRQSEVGLASISDGEELTLIVAAGAAQTGVVMQARPILPRTPAAAAIGQGHGHAMFRMLLEDLSGVRFEDEDSRLMLLAILDQTPVAYQAEVGDRLLQLLQEAKQTELGTCSSGFRWILDTQRPHQVGFGVFNQLSRWHNEAFRSRLLLQHHRMTRHDWDEDEEAATVGVLLTPNYYRRDRLWDTTVMAIFGTSSLEADDVAAHEAFWNQPP